jgi:hypothetical protein
MKDRTSAEASIPNITIRDMISGILKYSDTNILLPTKNNITANPGLR